MDKNAEDEVVIQALLKRFNNQRLPRALDIEKKVMSGAKLDGSDMEFLEMVFNDAQYILYLSDKHPEYQDIISRAIQLYADITKKALENEQKIND